jgi:FkbM family methyltransferase
MLTRTWKRFTRWTRPMPAEWARQQLAEQYPGVLNGFQCRPGTIDAKFFRTVVLENEYRLPRFELTDLVLDIGAHIGSFLASAYVRGARRLVGFEPEPDNFAWLQRNARLLGGAASIENVAVWRSDRTGDVLTFAPLTSGYNTGQHSVVFGQAGHSIPTRSLDSILAEHTNEGREPVRFLKIDCEGAEFPILMTSQCLGWVREIAGEFHEFLPENHQIGKMSPAAALDGVREYTMPMLASHLEQRGFCVEFQRTRRYPNLGWFFARR